VPGHSVSQARPETGELRRERREEQRVGGQVRHAPEYTGT